MHQEIRHNLEDYLKGSVSGLPAGFDAHLGECAECASQLRSLQAQSQLLRELRSPRDIEPRAGFYTRVLERIESQPASIWAIFLERKFGLRLAVASAALVALLGTYLVTSEPSGPEFASAPAVVMTDTPPTAEASLRTEENAQQQQQRDEVLVDLASYHQ
jgi:predicted anti-sigma-YlaC factor YlaD